MNSVITFFILLALNNLQNLILGSYAETSDNLIFNRNVRHYNEINDDIRCYCNLPKCITQGFICQTNSKSGGCFAERRIVHEEITPLSNAPNNRLVEVHGCIELELQKNKCNKNKSDQTSSFICCHENFCNIFDIHKINSNQLLNSSTSNDSKTTLDQNRDWCILATIIVPIISAIILFFLITIAIKIFRSNRTDTLATSNKSCSTDYEKNHFIRNQIIIDNSLIANPLAKDKNEYNLLKNNCNRSHRKIDKTSTKSTNTQTNVLLEHSEKTFEKSNVNNNVNNVNKN